MNEQGLKTLWTELGGGEPCPQFCCFDCVDSTNRLAWEAPTLPTAIIAQQQTAGRGQWGRTWQSPIGGLYLSLAIPPPDLPPLIVTLVAGWAIASTLRDRHLPITLKWPNDLLLEGRKLGGIKTEQRSGTNRLVIGIGINWSNPVPPGGINVQSAQTYPSHPNHILPSLEHLATLVVIAIQQGLIQWPTPQIPQFLPQYWELLESRHRSVTLAGATGEIIGITPTGELRVRLRGQGTQTELICPPGAVTVSYPDLSPQESP
ncbi:biotin--[acetyl-CoA-carboxylase] ligase [Spirulina sp. CCNP1310]|uniref:biotin--[acetyl-CoA-carboxylase] ligase n=1 Tax=Spirulina sp. CCNP1310 TaxID=3110249 RepID=UPI002B21F10F|nr:biotin--[acetyl-CoA-carboxylase] ligase [Spirulina sp. CCNP1310]MEA5420188.1 biotin--[acetyl-CoA-carboxylase] ligase [Spirulina sp. CCNP1310]